MSTTTLTRGGRFVREEDLKKLHQQEYERELSKIQQKFDILRDRVVNFATSDTGIFKGLLVTGPAGIGKSVTIEQGLKEAVKQTGKTNVYQGPIKGKVTPLGFYTALWENKGKNRILWFDDVFGILDNEVSIELLKAATSRQHEPRKIQWLGQMSAHFKEKQMPQEFNYEGHIILSTNKNVSPAAQGKKMRDHFAALTSRMPPTDLTLDRAQTYMWTEYLITDGGMLDKDTCISHKPGYGEKIKKDTLDYLYEHQDNLHELTPRIADSIAGARFEFGPERGYRKNEWLKYADEITGRFDEEGNS